MYMECTGGHVCRDSGCGLGAHPCKEARALISCRPRAGQLRDGALIILERVRQPDRRQAIVLPLEVYGNGRGSDQGRMPADDVKHVDAILAQPIGHPSHRVLFGCTQPTPHALRRVGRHDTRGADRRPSARTTRRHLLSPLLACMEGHRLVEQHALEAVGVAQKLDAGVLLSVLVDERFDCGRKAEILTWIASG